MAYKVGASLTVADVEDFPAFAWTLFVLGVPYILNPEQIEGTRRSILQMMSEGQLRAMLITDVTEDVVSINVVPFHFRLNVHLRIGNQSDLP
jgi:hypothetical protein